MDMDGQCINFVLPSEVNNWVIWLVGLSRRRNMERKQILWRRITLSFNCIAGTKQLWVWLHGVWGSCNVSSGRRISRSFGHVGIRTFASECRNSCMSNWVFCYYMTKLPIPWNLFLRSGGVPPSHVAVAYCIVQACNPSFDRMTWYPALVTPVITTFFTCVPTKDVQVWWK